MPLPPTTADSPQMGDSYPPSCSRILGYRVKEGAFIKDILIKDNRRQRMLNQVSIMLKCGWMVTDIIYSENDGTVAPPPQMPEPYEQNS